MFSYLDGFVTICSQVDAMEVVNLVNSMFIAFDKLTEQHDVYKVTKLNMIIMLCGGHGREKWELGFACFFYTGKMRFGSLGLGTTKKKKQSNVGMGLEFGQKVDWEDGISTTLCVNKLICGPMQIERERERERERETVF